MKDKKCMCIQQWCILCCRKARVRRQPCANAASGAWAKTVDVCVAEERRRVLFPFSFFSFFLALFFLLVSPTVYPTPLFSIFTCSSRCEGSEILNYRNALVSAKTTQPVLSPDLTHTFSHFHCHSLDPRNPTPTHSAADRRTVQQCLLLIVLLCFR